MIWLYEFCGLQNLQFLYESGLFLCVGFQTTSSCFSTFTELVFWHHCNAAARARSLSKKLRCPMKVTWSQTGKRAFFVRLLRFFAHVGSFFEWNLKGPMFFPVLNFLSFDSFFAKSVFSESFAILKTCRLMKSDNVTRGDFHFLHKCAFLSFVVSSIMRRACLGVCRFISFGKIRISEKLKFVHSKITSARNFKRERTTVGSRSFTWSRRIPWSNL